MADDKVKPTVITDDNFEEVLAEAGDKPVMVDFYADWCGPCQMVAPTIEGLADEYKDKAIVAKLNVDENPKMAQQYMVMSIPTVMVFKNGEVAQNEAGKEIKQIGAFNKQGYVEMIEAAM